jgi:hypothetical protein
VPFCVRVVAHEQAAFLSWVRAGAEVLEGLAPARRSDSGQPPASYREPTAEEEVMPSEDAEAYIRQARDILNKDGPQMTPGERATALACLAQAEMLASGITIDRKTHDAIEALRGAADTFAKSAQQLIRKLDNL